MTKRWVFSPWADGCYSSFGHAWETFWRALGCLVLGHDEEQFGESKDCNRCGRKWCLKEGDDD